MLQIFIELTATILDVARSRTNSSLTCSGKIATAYVDVNQNLRSSKGQVLLIIRDPEFSKNKSGTFFGRNGKVERISLSLELLCI